MDRKTKRKKTVQLPPVWTGHADFTNPFEFARFMRDCEGMEFDVMLEGKAKDISLLKLRPDLLRYAPDVAARFGITAAGAQELEAEEATLETEQSPAEVDEAPDVRPDSAKSRLERVPARPPCGTGSLRRSRPPARAGRRGSPNCWRRATRSPRAGSRR